MCDDRKAHKGDKWQRTHREDVKMDIRKEVEAIKEEIIGWREEFHQYPEVGMEEYRTAERIREELEK